MALTEDEITAGQTYTVTIDGSLSGKRFRDAVALIKGINGRLVGLVYDPQNPAAYRTGYVESKETATATYDGATRAWTVMIPAGGGYPLADLRSLVHAYDAEVEVAGTGQPAAPAPAAAPAKPPRAPRSHVRNGIDWAEYGDGFSPVDERPYMGS